jgi:uncharacterized membrane protein YeaQ/YmgE (transglycosylase-associated protein family)
MIRRRPARARHERRRLDRRGVSGRRHLGRSVGGSTARGCLPNIVVGILGGLIGGWLATQLGFSDIQGFIAAVVVAVFGSVVIRLVLNAINDR